MSQILNRPVRICLLGEFQLIVDGVDKTPLIAYGKPKLLLAMLALSLDKKQSRAALAELLWPNCASGARANLRHALCVLRHVLGPMEKAILSTSSMLALDQNLVTVDVLALCGIGAYARLTLEERLSHDRGDLLEHMVTPVNAALSAWRMSWQSRLSQEVSQCRQAYIAQLCAEDRIQDALASARQWVQVHPGDEHAHRDLIRLLRDTGRRESAMKAYEHCVAVMGEYYGTTPSLETRSLLDVSVSNDRAVHASSSANDDARPLAVLAVAIGHDGDGVPGEETIDRVQAARQRLVRLAQAAGRRVCLGADGNLAILFGYPTLNERPTESAARLACYIRRCAISPHVSLGMGIHAELARVPPDNGTLPMMLVGQRALRLAYLAESGETLLTDAAQARLSDRFVVRPDERYGLHVGVLEGQSQAITVHRMFGRTTEFDILVRRWNSLRKNERPHVMYLRGEQGIGKSLLAQVFAEYVRRGGGVVTFLRCDQENRQLALHPFHEYFLSRLAVQDGVGARAADDAELGYARAIESLGYRVGLDKATSAMLVDYFVGQRSGAIAPAPAEPDVDALVAPLSNLLLDGDAPSQPLLILVDDAQWADAATRGLLTSLLQHRRRDPVMILLCGRGMNLNVPIDETITMPPLRRDAMVQLVTLRGKDKRLSSKIRRRIVEKARGVPLYAEQMVRQCPADIEEEPPLLIRDLLAARAVCEREDAADVAVPRLASEYTIPFIETD
ncbi:AAA family ATPase [Bordetella sputigena]|uniref:AAA family ATPase n=1 Tax=Bordetella sputigena TaxID=1416810 RepID=UPI0039EF73A7